VSSNRAPRPLDGLAVTALGADLRERATGLRIDRVRRVGQGHVVLRLRPGTACLVVCAAGRLARVTCVAEDFANAITSAHPSGTGDPDSFVSALRRHLTGTVLERVSQPGGERLLSLAFRGRDALGDMRTHHLHVEMTGRHGNIILADEDGIVLEADRPVPGHMSRVRRILPGLPYVLPPVRPGCRQPGRGLPAGDMPEERTIVELLPAWVQGLSREDARDRLEEIGIQPELQARQLSPADWQRLDAHLALLRTGAEAGKLVPRRLGPGSWRLDTRTDATASDAVEQIMAEAGRMQEAARDTDQARLQHERLLREARAEVARLCEVLDQLPDTDHLRLEASLLLTWLPQVTEALQAGATSISLRNLADDDEILVKLGSGPTAAAEASRRHAAVRKAEGTRQHLLPRLAEAEARCHRLAWTDPDPAADPAPLPASPRPTADPAPKGPGLRGRSSDGWLIVAGRSPRESDLLLRDWARPDDWWFHADRHAGGHILARPPVPGTALPDRTLHEAATWAACRSSGREDSRVTVLVTQRRHIRKAKGLPPGKVLHRQARTVLVAPDPDVVRRLLDRARFPDAPDAP